MAFITNEYSQLPQTIYTRHNFKNITNTVASLVTQIRTLQASGDYASAAAIVDANKATLQSYLITADTINAIEEETRNLEIMATDSQQIIYNSTQPTYANQGSVWIGSGAI